MKILVLLKLHKIKHFIQKTYKALDASTFPTRNTKTRVFGSDVVEENICINTANTSVNSNININTQNVCAQCSAALQSGKLGQNLSLATNTACPGCGKILNINESICSQCGYIIQQSLNIQQNLNEASNSQCPGCGRMLEITGQNLLDQATQQIQNLASQSIQKNQNLVVQNNQQSQNMIVQSSQQNQNLAQNVINSSDSICPICQINEKTNIQSNLQKEIIETKQNLVEVQNSLCPGCGRMTVEHF